MWRVTTIVVVVEILPSARKHAIVDDDIRHAYTHAIASIAVADQPDFTMLIGADGNGQLLEIGVLAADDNDYVIHAMRARSRYLRLINQDRGDER